jgi:hypothetical protein
MNRRFWGGALVISLLITAAAGYYVMHQVQNKEIVSMMPTESIAPVSETPAPVEPTLETPAAVEPTVSPAQTETAPAVSESAPVEKRRILFSLPRPNAKSVTIVGDFNNWQPDVMEKHGRKWERVVLLEPGSYSYMFVVDKKRIRDPNNKTTADGKSVITVKPLAGK